MKMCWIYNKLVLAKAERLIGSPLSTSLVTKDRLDFDRISPFSPGFPACYSGITEA